MWARRVASKRRMPRTSWPQIVSDSPSARKTRTKWVPCRRSPLAETTRSQPNRCGSASATVTLRNEDETSQTTLAGAGPAGTAASQISRTRQIGPRTQEKHAKPGESKDRPASSRDDPSTKTRNTRATASPNRAKRLDRRGDWTHDIPVNSRDCSDGRLDIIAPAFGRSRWFACHRRTGARRLSAADAVVDGRKRGFHSVPGDAV
jgi:hypothetical protein